jgi:hypothetical protein
VARPEKKPTLIIFDPKLVTAADMASIAARLQNAATAQRSNGPQAKRKVDEPGSID